MKKNLINLKIKCALSKIEYYWTKEVSTDSLYWKKPHPKKLNKYSKYFVG